MGGQPAGAKRSGQQVGLLPFEFYVDIHRSVPLCCVDLVVLYRGKLLFVKRANEPAKGEWWLIGGRVLRGETLVAAARRLLRSEAGLDIERVEKLGCDETFFDTDPFGHGAGTHTINVVLKVTATGDAVKLDPTSEAFSLVSTAQLASLNLTSYVAKFVRQAIQSEPAMLGSTTPFSGT